MSQRRAFYEANRAEQTARQRAYYQEHLAKCQADVRAYDATHADERRTYRKEWKARNLEHVLDGQRRYYRENHARLLAQKRAYRNSHRDHVRAHNNLRKARQRGVTAKPITGLQWATIKAAYKFRCAYCGKKPDRLTMDHVIPLAKGGPHALENIVPACMPCNNHKKTREAPTYQPTLL